MWKYLFVLMLIWNPCFGQKSLDFLLSKKGTAEQIYKKLQPSLRQLKDPSYSRLHGSFTLLGYPIRSSLFYHKENELRWMKVELYDRKYFADKVSKIFIQKFGHSKGGESINKIKYRLQKWRVNKNRAISLIELNAGLCLELRFKNKENTYRHKGKKSKTSVLLSVPVLLRTFEYHGCGTAYYRAASYTKKRNFDAFRFFQEIDLKRIHIRSKTSSLWLEQSKILKQNRLQVEPNMKGIADYYGKNPQKYSKLDKIFANDLSFRMFKNYIWKHLIKHKPVVISTVLGLRDLQSNTSRVDGFEYVTPVLPTFIKRKYFSKFNKELDHKTSLIRVYDLLVVGLNLTSNEITISQNDGSLITVPLIKLYASTNKYFTFE